MASTQWVGQNLYSATLFTQQAASNASANGQSVDFSGIGFVKLSRSWEYLNDNSNFATSLFQLKLAVIDNLLAPLQYRGDISIQIDLWYWTPGQDEYVKTRGESTTLIFNASTDTPADATFLIEADESYLIAQIDITFRCMGPFRQQSLWDIYLDCAISEVQKIRDEINSSLARGVLTQLDFYTDGFIASFETQTLSYKYQVTNGQLTGLIHQPSGFLVKINTINTPVPGETP